MSLLGTIEKKLIGSLPIVDLAEQYGEEEVASLLVQHAQLTQDELKTNAKRLRDAAACLEADPPKLKNALKETLAFYADTLD